MDRLFGNNWKTNVAGILALIGTILATFAPKYVPIEQQIAYLLFGGSVGAGLISAKDAGRKEP